MELERIRNFGVIAANGVLERTRWISANPYEVDVAKTLKCDVGVLEIL